MTASEASIGRVAARAYKIPTDAPEADGTFGWDSTVLVLVEVEAGGETGLGYTYSDASIAVLVEHALTPVLTGRSAFEIGGANAALWRKVRNFGRSGLVATAISALDAALWDLKAKLLALAVASLLGRRRDRVPIYGSGGFTTYSDERLARQLSGWIEQDGCCWVKMKIGSEPERDPARVEARAAPLAKRVCLSTPTVPTRPSRRWSWPNTSPPKASHGCRAPWSTCCRLTCLGAAGLQAFFRPLHCARRAISIFQDTATSHRSSSRRLANRAADAIAAR